MTDKLAANQKPRRSRLEWVALGDMKVSPKAQRDFSKSHAEALASDFELEAMGFLVLSKRDGSYWVVDGQHRREALLMVGFEPTDKVQCEVYEGMTEEDEGTLFIRRDQRRKISAFDAFKIKVNSPDDWPMEADVNRIANTNGVRFDRGKEPGTTYAVTTHVRVYRRAGAVIYGRTLRIAHKAFGDGGLDRAIFEGIGLVCERYDGLLPSEDECIAQLAAIPGGANGVHKDAHKLHLQIGGKKSQCTAAVIVDALNRGLPTSRKLASWWK